MVDAFISLIDEQSHLDRTDAKFFQNLVEHPVGVATGNKHNSSIQKLISYVLESPHVLLCKIKSNFVFDYFYEQVISDKVMNAVHNAQWHDGFIKIINILDNALVGDTTSIKQDKKYILKLQSTYRSLNKIFKSLLNAGFDMGDSEFLVYSIIARGEFVKLKTLAESYVIEDYPGVLDIALRYGRLEIIIYFLSQMKIDTRLYGKIVDFENYTDNCRYMYYVEQISQNDTTCKYKSPIALTKQDYSASLKLILEKYEYDITIKTLEVWCECLRNKTYEWDIFDSRDLLTILKDKVTETIPITHDFREFNSIILGSEWSDRNYLVEHCLDLERRLAFLQDRYNIVYDRLQNLQKKDVQYNVNREYFKGSRIRRDTQ